MNEIKLEQRVSNTEFSIFVRQLHIFVLLQHSTFSENMNYRTIADLLDLVSLDKVIENKKITMSVEKMFLNG